MSSWLVLVIALALVLAAAYFAFSGLGRRVSFLAGFVIFVGLLLGVGWMASRQDWLPSGLPASVEGLLSLLWDPFRSVFGLVGDLFRASLVGANLY